MMLRFFCKTVKSPHITFIVCALLSTALHSETELSIAPVWHRFDYTEFNDVNSVVDRELGWIPGLRLALSRNLNSQLRLEFELSEFQGTIDYTGQTNTGIAHRTQTDEILSDRGIRLIQTFSSQLDFLLAAQSRKWRRDIRDNNGVFGLYEVYSWYELSAGTRVLLSKSQSRHWLLECSVLRIVNPDIFIDLSRANSGTAKLALGEEYGARIKLYWANKIGEHWSLSVNPYIEIWQFGKSGQRRTSTGSTIVSEPRSETGNSGIQFDIRYTY